MFLFTKLTNTDLSLIPFSSSTSYFLFLPLCFIISSLYNFSDFIYNDFSPALLSHLLILPPTNVLIHQWLIKLQSSALVHLSFSPIIRPSLPTLTPVSLTSVLRSCRVDYLPSHVFQLTCSILISSIYLCFTNLTDSWANINSSTLDLLISSPVAWNTAGVFWPFLACRNPGSSFSHNTDLLNGFFGLQFTKSSCLFINTDVTHSVTIKNHVCRP